MLKAKDIMTKKVIVIDQDATLIEAIKRLVENRVSGMPVINRAGKMVGLISEKDVLNFIFSGNLEKTKVKEAMTKKVTYFSPDTDIDKIALTISEKMYRRVPIVDNGKLVGIVSRHDIIRSVIDK